MASPPRAPTRRARWRETLIGAGPAVVGGVLLVLALLLFAAWRVLDPTPSKRLVMATGPAQGAYVEFAKRYVPLLRAQGVTVELRATQGSGENLALLADPGSGVQVAFVQAGVPPAPGTPEDALVRLGSVAWEPLWVFYRDGAAAQPPQRLAEVTGWRFSVGPPGGGSGVLFRQLMAANQVPPDALHLSEESAVNGVVALVQGRVDALAMVSAADAPLVQYLLQTPGVRLLDFAQAEAYARRFPYLHPLVLPRGVADLAADQPPTDVHLVATTASLVARADLHPALVQLLVQSAAQVHREGGWFHRAGEFPRPAGDGWPLADEAERFYRNGTPWLQRHLPFWLANFIDRMWIVIVPLAAVLLPLSRILPPLVTLRLRSRVFRWYADLRAVEQAVDRPQADPAALVAELDRIDGQLERLGVPLAYTNELYELRSHVNLVRRRLAGRTPKT